MIEIIPIDIYINTVIIASGIDVREFDMFYYDNVVRMTNEEYERIRSDILNPNSCSGCTTRLGNGSVFVFIRKLRWCTGKENMRNPISMENARIAQEKRWNSKKVKVYALTQSGEMKYLALFTSTKGASRYTGVKFETIETHIKSGKPHKGYIFQRPKENE